MNYLTKAEQERVAAVKNYEIRKLTPAEYLVRDVAVAAALPSDNQENRKAKELVVEELYDRALNLSATSTLANRVRLACYADDHPESELGKLLTDYPYIKYDDLIGYPEKLTPLERRALAGFTLEELQRQIQVDCAIPSQAMKELLDYVPAGVKTMVWTPAMGGVVYNLRMFRQNTKNPLAFGISLPKKLQRQVNENCQRFFAQDSSGLLSIKDIFKRMRLSVEEVNKFNLADRVIIERDVHLPGLTLGGPLTKLIDKEKNTELYFFV